MKTSREILIDACEYLKTQNVLDKVLPIIHNAPVSYKSKLAVIGFTTIENKRLGRGRYERVYSTPIDIYYETSERDPVPDSVVLAIRDALIERLASDAYTTELEESEATPGALGYQKIGDKTYIRHMLNFELFAQET